jgi:hypothetical protein
MVAIAFCLKVPDRNTTKVPWTEKLKQLDVPGMCCLIPGVVCLVLGLQWGGQKYAVSSQTAALTSVLTETVEQCSHHRLTDAHGRLAACFCGCADTSDKDGDNSSTHLQTAQHLCRSLGDSLCRSIAIHI